MNRRIQLRTIAILAVAVLVSLSGCKDFSFFSELGIKGAVTVNPSNITVAAGSSVTFSATGGNPPYTYAVVSGSGTIDPATGVYDAPAVQASAVVMATDSLGESGTASVSVVTTLEELKINPTSASVSVNNSISFVATGGVGPYTFDIQANNSGGNITTGGVYTAGSTIGVSDTIIVTDSDSPPQTCTVPAVVSVTSAVTNVDHSISADTLPDSAYVGTALSGEFTISNGGSATGTADISWWLFLSEDGTFGGDGEHLVASGAVTTDIPASSTQAVTPTGNWPADLPQGNYDLFVMISSPDDLNHGNNVYGAGAFTLNVPNVDYLVLSVTNNGQTHAGGSIDGEFSLDNQGSDDGSADLTWKVYVSTNTAVDVGDTLIDSYTTEGAMTSAETPRTIFFTGTWPSNPANYYLVVEVTSSEDTAAGNDSNNTTATTAAISIDYPDVDYQVLSVSHLSGTAAGGSLDGEFVLDNIGTDDGTSTVDWKVYASTNKSVDVGDALIAFGTEGSMIVTEAARTIGFSGTWPIEPALYYLVVEVTSFDDTQAANFLNNVTATGSTIDVTVADVDYYADAISAVPGDAGGPLSCSFDLNNGGGDASSTTVIWNLYVSANTTLDGGDYLASSGTAGPLGAAPSSTVINPSGATWPATPGSYYLIVEIESLEDIAAGNDGNDLAVSGSSFIVNAPQVDYYADAISAVPGDAGGPLSCSFSLNNGGGDASSTTVTWNLYVSANAILDGGDYLAAWGTAGPLGAVPSSTVINPSGATWPTTPGNYYLIVEIESSEDVAAGNDGNDVAVSGSTFNAAAPNVDYIVDQVNFVPGGSSYLPDGVVNGNFIYKNNGTSNGTQPVSWEAYASLDTTLDAGDVLIQSGSGLSPLSAGANSSSIAFSGKWPLDYGNYYLVVRVMSSDELNPTDNTGANTATEKVGYFDESLFEPNNDYIGLGDFYDTGVTFKPGMSIELSGTMSGSDLDDIMAFNTGNCTMITFAVTYASAKAQIQIFLMDGPNSFIDGVSGTPGAISLNWAVDAAGVQRYLNLDNRGDNPAYNGSYTCVITGH